MSFSSIPSFRSGTASPAKGAAQQNQNSTLSPSSLSNRSPSPVTLITSSSPVPATAISGATNFIPWTTSQGKLYKSVGDEAWKKCEKIVKIYQDQQSFN